MTPALLDPAAPPAVGPRHRDRGAAAAAARDGYVTLPVFTSDEAAALEVAYWLLIARHADGPLAIDYLRDDRRTMALVRDLVNPLLAPRLATHFTGHRIVFTTFVVKYPGDGSEMFLHEDRSWVDERRYRSSTVWIPLVDVGPDHPNGGLQVLPGSQRLATYWSGSLTPDEIRPYEHWLRPRLVSPSIPAGTGLVYDSRLLHASMANRSDRPRVALVCGLVPEEAQLIHVRATGTLRRALHAVDEDFFVRFGPRQAEAGVPSTYPVIEEVDETGSLSPQVVADRLGGGGAPPAASPVVPDDVPSEGADRWVPLPPAGFADQDDADGTVVRLGPGGRTALEGPISLAVLDAAPVATGIAGSGRAANLRIGDRFVLAEGVWALWNDGPGTLVVRSTPTSHGD